MFQHYCSLGMALALGILFFAASPVEAQSFRWSRGADLPLPNSMMGTAIILGDVYVLGGSPAPCVSTDRVFRYRLATNTWTEALPLPQSMSDVGATAVGGWMYAAGGRLGACGEYASKIHLGDGRDWRVSLPLYGAWPAASLTVVADAGYVYVFGGGNPNPSNAHYRFFYPEAWEGQGLPLPPITVGPCTGCGVAVDGKIYVLQGGGAPVLAYDPATSTWQVKSAPPDARSGWAVAAIGTKIFAVGGYLAEDNYPESILVYNTVTDRWTVKTKPLSAKTWFTGRYGLSLGRIGDRLIAIGGVRGLAAPTEFFDLVEIAKVK
jgi:hypothetical protein